MIIDPKTAANAMIAGVQLRPYQHDVIEEVRRHQRPLIVAPTGSGKTVVAAEIIRQAENKHVLFLAHRRELIFQTQRHLAEFGVNSGVILAGQPLDLMKGVQVASIQTLWSRCMRGDRELPHADIVFVDEGHHARALTYRKIIDSYPEAKVIGMTATPCRKDGRGLGSTFEALVECPQVQDLIDLGYLVPTRVYAPSTPDLKGVHTRQGDYVESELAERMDRPKLIGDIVAHWHRLAERRKTVCFATNVGHSIHLCEEFVRSGVKAEHIDGSTPKEQRDEVLRRLDHGEIELVTNCMVLTEGWDMPAVSCCVLARPTKSMGLFRQMAGRVIRPFPGKTDALILDHSGAVFRHGFVEDPVLWTLDEDTRAENPTHERRGKTETARLVECSQCSAIRTGGKPCPQCGFMPKRPATYLKIMEGDLAQVMRDGSIRPAQYSPELRNTFHRMLAGIALERGYKIGWAAYQFKERFGDWPDRRFVTPITANAEVRAWVRSRQIAYAKAKQKEAAIA